MKTEQELLVEFRRLEQGNEYETEFPNIVKFKYRIFWVEPYYPTCEILEKEISPDAKQLDLNFSNEVLVAFVCNRTNRMSEAQREITAFLDEAGNWGELHHKDEDAFFERNVW